MDEDEEGNKYLVIHTGSRNLGKQVAMLYQAMAIKSIHGVQDLASKQAELIARYKAQKREKEIQQALAELNRTYQPVPRGIPKELCYLTGQNREDYLHDMQICQRFAVLNRCTIANTIVKNCLAWISGIVISTPLRLFITILNSLLIWYAKVQSRLRRASVC